jgi:ribosomal protein S18 acetylase RimI-like enzyme
LDSWSHLTGATSFRPAFTFLAYEADEEVGEPLALVLSEEYEAVQQATGGRDLYVVLVATRRPGRKRGIATALLTHVLRQARAAGFDSASLMVDADSPTGALGLYGRIGFRAENSWVAQRRPIIPAPGVGHGITV